MSKAKRERKRQNQLAARAAQLEATRRARRRQAVIRTGVLVVVVVFLAVLAAFFFGRNGDDLAVGAGDDTETTATAPGSDIDEIVCDDREPEAGIERETYSEPPEMAIDPARAYTATIDTSCGRIVVELDAEGAPRTVNNFVFLAREGFYTGLTWHRVVEDFVIQGGDPDGDGTGGPGYQFEDELAADGYRIGSLAMANSGPNTNGSQFFIVTGSRGAALPNQFSRFGVVTEGIEVAQRLESFAEEDETPSRTLYIFSIEITET